MVATVSPEASPLQFHCDFCLAELCVPAAFAGVTGPCPHCGNTITSPSADFLITPIPPRPLKPIPVHLEPMPKLKRREERIRIEEPLEETGERKIKKPRRQWNGVAMFDKRGFRPVRLMLTMVSAGVIFGSFNALKSRRWIWQKPPAEAVEMVATPQETSFSRASESSAVALPQLPGIDRVLQK